MERFFTGKRKDNDMRSSSFWFKTFKILVPILAVCVIPFAGCTDPKDPSGYEQPIAEPPPEGDEDAARAFRNAIRESQGLPPEGADSTESEE